MYSRDDIALAFDELTADARRWERFFAITGVPVVRLVYEEIQADFDAALRRIARAAGLLDELPAARPDNDYRVQRTGVNSAWKRRFIAETDPNRFDGA